MNGRPGRVPTKQALKEPSKNTLEKSAPNTPSGQLMAINNGLTPGDEIARQEKRAPNTSKSWNTQQSKLDDAMPQPERKASNNPESRVFEYNVHRGKGWMVAGGFGAHQKGDIVVSRTVKDNLTEADDRNAAFIGGDIVDTKSFVKLFSRTGGNEEGNSNEDDRTEGDNEEDKK